MAYFVGSVSSDKIDADELKNYEDINENLAMIRSFQVNLTLNLEPGDSAHDL